MSKKKHKAKKHSEFRPEEPGHKEEQEEDKPAPQEDSPRESRLSIMAFIAVGVGMGFLSLTLSPVVGNYMTAGAAVLVAWAAGKLVGAALGRKDLKWLLGNGMAIYFFIWLIAWIFLFNLLGGGAG